MLTLLNDKNKQTTIPLLGTNLLVITLFYTVVRSYKGGLL
jgi:hypothetical protein